MTAHLEAPSPGLFRQRVDVRSWWRGDVLFSLSAAVCVLMVLVAVFGAFIAPYPPNTTDVLAANLPASPEHLMGTDGLGRDVFSRILVGARLSMLGPAIIVIVSTTLGVALALTSAWIGGTFDGAVNKVLNVMFAIPAILVAIIAVAVFGAGFWPPVIALSIIYIPYVARVLKGAAAQERNRAYVEALQITGQSAWQINVRHILRNLQPIIMAQATLNFGAALIDFGALSFLGLGVPAPTAEWGAMVSAGRSELVSGSPQQAMAAGAVIVVTVVAFNVLGERVSKRLGASL